MTRAEIRRAVRKALEEDPGRVVLGMETFWNDASVAMHQLNHVFEGAADGADIAANGQDLMIAAAVVEQELEASFGKNWITKVGEIADRYPPQTHWDYLRRGRGGKR